MPDTKGSNLTEVTSLVNADGVYVFPGGPISRRIRFDNFCLSITQLGTLLVKLVINVASDVVQFRVKGHSTQTSDLLELAQSDNTKVFRVTNAGNLITAGLVDNRNVSADGTLLDGIKPGATKLETFVVEMLPESSDTNFIELDPVVHDANAVRFYCYRSSCQFAESWYRCRLSYGRHSSGRHHDSVNQDNHRRD